jgi:glutathione S-transferase
MKTRAYLRFKQLPHEWVVRTAANMEEFNRHARIPLIPLWLPADGPAMQDSTRIIESVEEEHPSPSAMPQDPALAFVGWLLEEYADEWVNRLMAHFRWFRDAEYSARQTIDMRWPDATAGHKAAQVEVLLRERLPKILSVAGASSGNAPVLEASFDNLVRRLELHLREHYWLFGPEPSIADFALAGQLQQCSKDPTAGARMQAAGAERLRAWADEALDAPRSTGPHASWQQLAGTLGPLLREEVGGVFLPWTLANAATTTDVSVSLPAGRFDLAHQRYSASSLRALELRYRMLNAAARDGVDRLLHESGVPHPFPTSSSPHDAARQD